LPISEPPGRRRLFAIGAGRPFADDLAAGLLSRSGGDALAQLDSSPANLFPRAQALA